MTRINLTRAEIISLAASINGSVRSERKAAAARENGKKGGRPRKRGKRSRKPAMPA